MDFIEKNTSSIKEIKKEIKNEAVNAQKEKAAPGKINEVKPEEKKAADAKKSGNKGGAGRTSVKDIKEKAKSIEVVVPKTEKEKALDKVAEMHRTLLDSEAANPWRHGRRTRRREIRSTETLSAAFRKTIRKSVPRWQSSAVSWDRLFPIMRLRIPTKRKSP